MRVDAVENAPECAMPKVVLPFRLSSRLIPGAVICADLFAILTAGFLVAMSPRIGDAETLGPVLGLLIIGVPCLLSRLGLYRIRAILAPASTGFSILAVVLAVVALQMGLSLVLGGASPGARTLGALGLATVLAMLGARILTAPVVRRLGGKGVVGRNVALLGTPDECRLLIGAMRDRVSLDRVAAAFSSEPIGADRCCGFLSGGPDALDAALRTGAIDAVAIALPQGGARALPPAVERLTAHPVDLELWLVKRGGTRPVGALARQPMVGSEAIVKRGLDITLALLLLVLSAPLLGLIALGVRLDSPGPVLFRQTRLGLKNRPFTILKFRTMRHEPDSAVLQAQRQDPRCTRLGRLLRKTSLDELPQLLNVLEGTMSLVGPRPHAVPHNQDYGRRIRGYSARHRVRPGITGWAQVRGFRGETPRLSMMRDRVSHDIDYIERWSLLFDLEILLRTVLVVFFQRRAY